MTKTETLPTWRTYDLRDFAPEATLTSAGLTAINAAITEVNAAGGGVIRADRLATPYVINGLIVPRANVTLDFGGADVYYRGTATPMVGYANFTDIPGIASTLIDADVALGAVQLTVVSTAGLSAGDDVFVRLVQQTYDTADSKWSYWAKVVSVDSATLVTLDNPAPEAMTKASTATHSRVIYKVPAAYMVQNWGLRAVNFVNDSANGGDVARVISAQLWRSCSLDDISADDAGSGLINAYHSQDLDIGRVWVKSSRLNGNANKGRAISLSNGVNVRIGQLLAEDFEGRAIFIEGHSRAVVFGSARLKNTNVLRVNTTTPLIQITAESDVRFDQLIVQGNGDTSLVSEGASAETSVWSFGRLNVQTTSALRGGVRLDRIRDSANIRGVKMEKVRRWSKRLPLTASLTDLDIGLPTGYYQNVWVHVSTLTGVTKFDVVNTAGQGLVALGTLTAGQTKLLSPTTLSDMGTQIPFNTTTTKKTRVSTDGTVPAGAWAVVTVEYFPSIENDTSLALMQSYGNLTANADTSGATLGQLETEVNEIKATMRSLGMLAT